MASLANFAFIPLFRALFGLLSSSIFGPKLRDLTQELIPALVLFQLRKIKTFLMFGSSGPSLFSEGTEYYYYYYNNYYYYSEIFSARLEKSHAH